MACLRRSYAICVLILFVFLASHSFGQTPPLLRVDEQQIKFRLDSHPVLELPIVNTSDKTLVGDFRLELLDTNNKVESFVTGTFQEKPGTTVEKVEWPLDYLVNDFSFESRLATAALLVCPTIGTRSCASGRICATEPSTAGRLRSTNDGRFEGASRETGSRCVFVLMTRALESLCVELPSSSRWNWETMTTTQ